MKKLLIIMLSLLVIFSFVSCDSNKAQSENSEKAAEQTDKTEENLANIKEFVAAYRHFYQIKEIITYKLNSNGYPEKLSSPGLDIPYPNSDSDSSTKDYYEGNDNELEKIYGDLSGKKIDKLTDITASGKLTGNYTGDDFTITATDVKFNFKYTVKGDSSNSQDGEIRFNGTFKEETDSVNKLSTDSADFYVNDTHYVITYTCGVSSSSDLPVFKSGTINGKTVDVRFINAAVEAFTMIGA